MNLKEENRYLNLILSHMTTAVVVIDENHHIHFMNEQAEKCFGKQTDFKCYDSFLGMDEPCKDCIITNSINKGVNRHESLRRDSNGRFFDTISSVIDNESGNSFLVESFTDVTDRVNLEKEKKKLVRIVNKKKMETFKEILATLKHKVNNSLTGLLAAVDYLEQKDRAKELIDGEDPYCLMKEEINKIKDVMKRLSDLNIIANKEYIKGEMMIDLDSSNLFSDSQDEVKLKVGDGEK
jgi:nitrogen-specific signal transduction histidine kinase